MEKKRITVNEAALAMGVSPQFIRIGMQRGLFAFGQAVKMSNRWTYYINPNAFEKYLKGKKKKK